ncbi:MAG: isochorismatase family protein, partial [Finegoldia magna]|nr:isochorismatase family protein [Finegoldia magna]
MDKLLIVVDFQNDFVDGALGFDGADKLEDRICERIKKAREDNEQIIFTFDTHEENYLNTQEGKFLPVEHCIKGSNGHKLYGKVAELVEKDDILIEKPT